MKLNDMSYLIYDDPRSLNSTSAEPSSEIKKVEEQIPQNDNVITPTQNSTEIVAMKPEEIKEAEKIENVGKLTESNQEVSKEEPLIQEKNSFNNETITEKKEESVSNDKDIIPITDTKEEVKEIVQEEKKEEIQQDYNTGEVKPEIIVELSTSNIGVYYFIFAAIVVAALFFVLKDMNKGFNNYDREENNYRNNDYLSYNKLKAT